MPHSFNRIWIHSVWATKERQLLISMSNEDKIYNFIRQELVALGCLVQIVNGMPDHVHVLFLLNPQKSVADVVKYAKGSSSHSINDQNLTPKKFSWQKGYAAYSVSESQVQRVLNYIKNQKQHHLKNTYTDEFGTLLKLHGAAKF